MKTTPRILRRKSGYMLMECLVYLSLFFAIMGFSFAVLYSCWNNTKNARRNADDIVRAVRAGERWRDDIRAAESAPFLEAAADGAALHIPRRAGEIIYLLGDDALWRQEAPGTNWIQVLSGIASSRMLGEKRRSVAAWRWELELASLGKSAHLQPLFTFAAVPESSLKP